MRHQFLTSAVRLAERAVGRRRLAQFARLMTNQVRRDLPNDMETNGESLVQRVASQYPGSVIFDVGAHFGEWSVSAARHASSAPIIHAFEPSAYSAMRARDRLGNFATVHQLALSDTPGTAPLHIVHDGAGSNSLVSSASPMRATQTVEAVAVDTVDALIQKLRVDRLTLLKIDAEGHDLAVMRGARASLERGLIDMVQFEYNWRWIESRNYLRDAFDLFGEYGYHLGKITPDGIEFYPSWHPELETFVEANYLACVPPLAERLPHLEWWGP